jgi:hypothetical protein
MVSFGGARDLEYELMLLSAIRSSTVDGVPLTHLTLDGTHNLWHRFEQYVFSSDIVRFSATRSFDQYLRTEGGQSTVVSLKGVAVGLVGVVISGLAVLSLVVFRPKVIVFGIDRISDAEFKSDFRLHAIYSFLKARRVQYTEVLHTVFNKVFLFNLIQRLRLVVYLEAADVLFAILRALRRSKPKPVTIGNLDSLTDEEAKFARYVVKKYLGQKDAALFRISLLTFVLSVSRTRAVFAIDDARHYHDVCVAAHRVRVPVYAFQHGHYTRFHVGWLAMDNARGTYIRPDFLVVWSDYWKHELKRLGSVFEPTHILVGTPEKKRISISKPQSAHCTILIPHETDSPKKEMVKIFQEIAQDPTISIILKLRPDYTVESQLKEYPNLGLGEKIATVTSIDELASRPTCALGVYSTFLYDMVEAGIPVGVLVDVSPYGRGMVENRLASAIHSHSLLEDIRNLCAQGSEEVENRTALLKSGAHPIDETLESIARTIQI